MACLSKLLLFSFQSLAFFSICKVDGESPSLSFINREIDKNVGKLGFIGTYVLWYHRELSKMYSKFDVYNSISSRFSHQFEKRFNNFIRNVIQPSQKHSQTVTMECFDEMCLKH